VARLLLVHQDLHERQIIARHLQENADARIEYALTTTQAEGLIVKDWFDLILIDAFPPEMPCLQLAALAAYQNIPALLLSGSRSTSAYLQALGYSCLERPFHLETLVSEAQCAIGQSRPAANRPGTLIASSQATMSALTAEVAEAYRLFDLAIARLGYAKQ
jgi:DNA-binding NtrC family response regulator